MPSKDPRIDAYIGKAAPFARPILKHLRRIVHAGCPEVQETLKWSSPFFEHGGIMCNMAAFNEHCSFGFWKSALVLGSDKGNGNAAGDFGRITAISDLPSEEVLAGYVRKAAELNAAGTKVPSRAKPTSKPEPLVIPGDFESALRNNKKAKATFDAFPYSKRKDYVVWITEAKREETREQRLATSMEWLAEGKSRLWKYERK